MNMQDLMIKALKKHGRKHGYTIDGVQLYLKGKIIGFREFGDILDDRILLYNDTNYAQSIEFADPNFLKKLESVVRSEYAAALREVKTDIKDHQARVKGLRAYYAKLQKEIKSLKSK